MERLVYGVCCSVLRPAHIYGDGTCVQWYKQRDVHMLERRCAAKFVNEIRRHAPHEASTNGVQKDSNHTLRVEHPAANQIATNGITVA